MSWGGYFMLALLAVCIVFAVFGFVCNFALGNLFGADAAPPPTRRCDMRLVADQTRQLAKAAPTRAQIDAAQKAREAAVRHQAVTAALIDAGADSAANARANPYRLGSAAAKVWQATYDRVAADCHAAAQHARA